VPPPQEARCGRAHEQDPRRGSSRQRGLRVRLDGAWQDPGGGGGSRHGDYVDWLTIRNLAESVTTDVERIRNHPLVPRDIAIYGYIYQVESGRLVEVPDATAVGRAA
jgi:carbonic anhydrase